MEETSVLIVGAGPTGLVLALWLTRLGVSVRIIDKAAEPGTTSRALAVHARTLELYRQLDLDAPVMAQGYTVPGVRLWVGGRQKARVPFEEIVSDLTPYGFLHIFPQDEHERLLAERLEAGGLRLERSTELLHYQDQNGRISAQLRHADGTESTVLAHFIAGCDGARSKVRDEMDTGFPGGTYQQIFYVADVDGDGPAFNGELNVELDETDFLAIFPLADKGRIRLIGAIKREDEEQAKLSFDDVKDRAVQSLGLQIRKVNWFSVYRVHHRVTEHFRKGRAFLLGDAAHIHTPVGGQGMNTGIGDAINLAWKLHAVLTGAAADTLLDTFESERRAFALRLVKTTDRAFNVVASEGPIAAVIRTRLVPLALPRIVAFEAAREFMFRTVSQITLNYRDKGLAAGAVGSVHGGDRLPWVRTAQFDNYDSLKRIIWQVHVYGAAQAELTKWCNERRLVLEVYPWSEACDAAGLRRDALYLIRPDTYIALASAHQTIDAAEQLLKRFACDPSASLDTTLRSRHYAL